MRTSSRASATKENELSVRAPAASVPAADRQALSRFFRVLGDPTRLRIVEALLERERTVSEIVELIGAPQSRVSNHLACLRWCRFVESERQGRTVVYRIADERTAALIELARSLTEPNCDHLASCRRIGPDWI
jgi:DNA-binding transcriptional ArsR family regulator